jgi:hypothetical protein
MEIEDQQRTQNGPTFITSSLPLASFLVAGGHLQFRDVELTDPQSAIFVFEDPQGRGRELARAFALGAAVSAIDFHAQLRQLRGALNVKLSAARSGVTEQLKLKGDRNHARSFASQL